MTRLTAQNVDMSIMIGIAGCDISIPYQGLKNAPRSEGVIHGPVFYTEGSVYLCPPRPFAHTHSIGRRGHNEAV